MVRWFLWTHVDSMEYEDFLSSKIWQRLIIEHSNHLILRVSTVSNFIEPMVELKIIRRKHVSILLPEKFKSPAKASMFVQSGEVEKNYLNLLKIYFVIKTMAEKGFAEDRMGRKIDRCFSDAVIKAGKSRFREKICYIRVLLNVRFYFIRCRFDSRRCLQPVLLQETHVAALRRHVLRSRSRLQQLREGTEQQLIRIISRI